MAAEISEVIAVSVSVAAGGASAAGFGTNMAVGANGPGGVNSYTSLASMTLADYSASDAEAVAGAAMFTQSPKPTLIKTYTTIADVLQQQTITFDIDFVTGNTVTFTIDGSDTAIVFNASNVQTYADIKTALDLRADVNTTVIDAGARTVVITTDASVVDGELTVTNATAGGATQPVGTLVETVAAVSLITNLNALEQLDTDWYMLVISTHTSVDIQRAASWVETRRHVFGWQDDDPNILVAADTTDVAFILQAANRTRTFGLYHDDNTEDNVAGWIGNVIAAADPDIRTTTWANQTIASGVVVDLTTTQSSSVRGITKTANTFETIGSNGRTRPGQLHDGTFIDIRVTVDWLTARLEEALFNLITAAADNGSKIPFTQAGIDQVEGEISGVRTTAVNAGHVADGTVVIFMPVIASISVANKAARTLTGILVSADLAGAVQTITISVTLAT